MVLAKTRATHTISIPQLHPQLLRQIEPWTISQDLHYLKNLSIVMLLAIPLPGGYTKEI